MRILYHVRNVVEARELVEAESEMPQSCETGNPLHPAQTVTVKVEHLDIESVEK